MTNKINKTLLICIAVAVLGLVMVFVFKASPLFTFAILLCPLMHVFMMSGGEHKH